jgi:hypothetical protein
VNPAPSVLVNCKWIGAVPAIERWSVMPPSALSEDEFRLLAYVRGYADHRDQRLDPSWVQEQLEFGLDQLRAAARGLARRGLAEFFEWRPDDPSLVPPDFQSDDGPMPMDLKLTSAGWDYLRQDRQA